MLYKMGIIGDETVNSDSVNLGSNPSSPATQKAHETGTSDDFRPVERDAKSEQNGYGRSTEPGTVPKTGQSVASRDFERWLDTHAAELGPDLHAKAQRVHQSLLTANQAAWSQSPALQAATMADVDEFHAAYAEHKAREVV
jgi:hypothetical protein